nr:unnamed protein product [Ipomoea batatas]
MSENIPRIIQATAVRYSVHQKSQESFLFMRANDSWSRHSNFHRLSPSSLISFHHLKPTKMRPLTFLTTQKSRAASRTVTTNMMTKLSTNRAESM